MLFNLVKILLLTWSVDLVSCNNVLNLIRSRLPRQAEDRAAGDVGSRLILTPYIESGNIEEARNLSKVSGGPFPEDIPSFSGFFTVNNTYDSNLFFWFFPAETDYLNAPVLVWLNGGPGSSSLFGLFTELGPFRVVEDDATLVRNPYSWHRNHSIIFFDNPVGTGFSFTNDSDGYAKEETQIGVELYIALIQFYTMFPELQKLPLYLTGESYAGKYIPTLGYTIHQRNPMADLKLNFQGISVGNGLTDPLTMMAYSNFLYQLGLIDTNTYDRMQTIEANCQQLISEEKYTEAFTAIFSELTLFYDATEYSSVYNILQTEEPQVGGNYHTFLEIDEVRKALHVGDAPFSDTTINTVMLHLLPDLMVSAKPSLEALLDNYRVLYYNGDLDIIVAYSVSVRMYNTLQFRAAEEYRNATRVPWYVDGELAGYMKSAGNFTEVLVRNAGHMVPTDQPKWAFDLINRFTSDNLLHSRK